METGKKLCSALHVMLTQAEVDFEMWRAMRQARLDPEVIVLLNRRYGRFYVAAENALFNSLITILYKAFETRKDTVNFIQLRKVLPKDIEVELESELTELFNQIQRVWKRVAEIRNKVVGHQSLELGPHETQAISGITFDEVRSFIENSQRLILLIAQQFYDTHIVFNIKGTGSFDNLIADLRVIKQLKGDAASGAR